MTIDENWLNIKTGKYKCPECEKEYTKNGIGTHIWRTHGDGKDWTGNIDAIKGKPSWNKGLNKQNSEKIKKQAESLSLRYKNGELIGSAVGRVPSEETKRRISEGMKIAHAEGRAHNIGQCRWNNEMSYPEKFFKQVIENEFEDKNFVQEYNIGIYSIDFAWVEKKLAIEIDGEQHEKPDYKSRDIRKDKKLKEEGWKVLRIKWKDMFNDTKHWIQISKNFVKEITMKNGKIIVPI